jgi:hypothetical protein
LFIWTWHNTSGYGSARPATLAATVSHKVIGLPPCLFSRAFLFSQDHPAAAAGLGWFFFQLCFCRAIPAGRGVHFLLYLSVLSMYVCASTESRSLIHMAFLGLLSGPSHLFSLLARASAAAKGAAVPARACLCHTGPFSCVFCLFIDCSFQEDQDCFVFLLERI